MRTTALGNRFLRGRGALRLGPVYLLGDVESHQDEEPCSTKVKGFDRLSMPERLSLPAQGQPFFRPCFLTLQVAYSCQLSVAIDFATDTVSNKL